MYQKAGKGWAKHLDFIILDLICLYVSYLLAYIIRHGHIFSMQNTLYRNVLLVFLFVQLCVSYINDSFKNVTRRGRYQEALATLRHVVLIMLVMTAYFFLTQEGEAYSRLVLVYTGVIYFILSYTARTLWKAHLARRPDAENADRSLLLISTSDRIQNVIEKIKENNFNQFKFSGIVLMDDSLIGQSIEGIEVVADKDTLFDYIGQEWVDEVFLDSILYGEQYHDMVNDFVDMGLTVHTRLWEDTEMQDKKQTVERIGNFEVLTSSINMMTWQQSFAKRCMDIAGGLVGCAITGVLFIFVAPAIYIASPGPIFFSQVRVGKNGRKFKIYKFRSMVPDAEAKKENLSGQNKVESGLMFKMDNDPRIIGGPHGIGSFIRRYSIDEFPQFWNVLKGDMSLVGTRPPTVDEWEKYNFYHRSRLSIKPGITGMWQTNGRSNITDFDEIVELDRYYISHWSLGLDIKILLKTVQVVLKREGSS